MDTPSATSPRLTYLSAATQLILDHERSLLGDDAIVQERGVEWTKTVRSFDHADLNAARTQYVVARYTSAGHFERDFGVGIDEKRWHDLVDRVQTQGPMPDVAAGAVGEEYTARPQHFGELAHRMLGLLDPRLDTDASEAVLLADAYGRDATASVDLGHLFLLAGSLARGTQPLLEAIAPDQPGPDAIPRILHLDQDGITSMPEVTSEGNKAHHLSDSARVVLAEAFALAEGTGHYQRHGVARRHLLAALLDSSDLAEELKRREVDVAALRRAFNDHFRKAFEDSGETAVQLVEPQSARQTVMRPGYDPENTEGEDLLGIDGDAEAFATLATAKAVPPPLSVGLFGEWGSGKSFFMSRMRHFVNEYSRRMRDSGRPQRELDYYKRVVQVEFNAWHYAEGNLWASLVEHLFSNLRISPKDEDAELRERQEALLDEMELEKVALKEAEEARRMAKQAAENAETELRTKRSELERTKEEAARLRGQDILSALDLSAVSESGQTLLNELGVTALGGNLRELDAEIKQQVEGVRGSGVFAALKKDPLRAKRFLFLGILVAAGLLLPWLVPPISSRLVAWITKAPAGESVADTLGIVAAWAAMATEWVRRQGNWISGWLEKANAAQAQLEAAVAARKAKVEELLEAERLKVEDRREALRKAEVGIERARERLTELEQELEETTPAARLGRFIEKRASSDDYRKHLGLVALIRRDFERLSKLIDAHNKALEKKQSSDDEVGKLEQEGGLQGINRIVLYIDDLDRCQTKRVVEVLEAVHLLLAFPLFVVVVGVDARWVRRALRVQHTELFELKHEPTGSGTPAVPYEPLARPDDYLEKIFQVPFWLRPVGRVGTRHMIRELLGPKEPDAKPGHTLAGEAPAQPPPPAEDHEPTEPTGTAPVFPEPEIPGQQELPQAGLAASGEQHMLESEALEIHERELVEMERLAGVIGRSPRAVKRFANSYRLLKARIFARYTVRQREEFQDDGPAGRFRFVMFLLAVVTGATQVSRILFAELRIWRGTQVSMFTELVGHRVEDAGLDEWMEVKEALEQSPWLRQASDLTTLAEWAPAVARYSFRIELSRGDDPDAQTTLSGAQETA